MKSSNWKHDFQPRQFNGKQLTSKSIILWILKFSNVNPWTSKTALTLPFIQSKVLQPYHESLSKKQFLWRKKNTKPSGQHAAQWCEMAKKGLQKVIASFCYKKRNQGKKSINFFAPLNQRIEFNQTKFAIQSLCQITDQIISIFFFCFTQWGHNLYEMGFSLLYIFIHFSNHKNQIILTFTKRF